MTEQLEEEKEKRKSTKIQATISLKKKRKLFDKKIRSHIEQSHTELLTSC